MKKTLLLIFLNFLSIYNLKASHAFGAELTYTCQGNGNYLITYSFYRDCFGISAPLTCSLTLNNICGMPADTFTLTSVSSYLVTSCSPVTTCNGGTIPGIEKYIYQTTITINDTCSQWILGVLTPSRNGPITMPPTGTSYNLYVEATLNNTLADCDTSVVFQNDPFIEACINQPYCLDPGIYDAEGDSTVVTLIPPLQDRNNPIPYSIGYSIQYPLGPNSPWILNMFNGTICFTSDAPLFIQYAIKVSTYRNGILLSEVERDMGLITIYCSASQPIISGFNGSATTDTFVCVNTQLCFDINTNDPDITDSTFISWDGSITGATFTDIPGKNESAQFCWTPDINDIGVQPHSFTVHVMDNACPAFQTNDKTFRITVYDSATCATLGINELPFSDIHLKIYPQPTNEFINVEINKNTQSLKLCIQDIFGNIIFEKQVTESKFSTTSEFLKPGIYFASLKNSNGAFINSVKFIKLN